MKITIVQSEIEEAIRQYIHNQIAVKEGHAITMDFTATRGEDGLIAAIDISPIAGGSATASAAVVQQVTDRQETGAVEAPAARRVTRAAPVAPAPVVDEQAAPEEVATGGEELSEAEGGKLRKSIFSDLRRPAPEAVEGVDA